MLSMSSLGTAHRACQIGCRAKRSNTQIDTTRKPRRDFLKQPAVAVRIAEQCLRAVSGAFGIETSDWTVSGEVEDLVYVDAAGYQGVSRGLDVSDDQVISLSRAGCGRRKTLAELHRTSRTVRCELVYARTGWRDVLSPPKLTVKLLRAFGI